ncbi:MAG: two-component system response regulator CreB [bacterium]|nr:two-component system response regulator CreB [bacterium]
MKPCIVIVEDEPAITDAIEFVLAAEACRTRVLHCGLPVLDLLAAGEEVDLIVLDIGLPDISGMDLLKRIRERSQVPVILLTARAGEIDRVLGLEIGADDYVVKPFSPRELAARVKAVLRRSGAGAAASSQAAPLEGPSTSPWRLDQGKRQISYCGVLLELSRYEYNLLLVLLQHPGHVYTRDQLMQQAWDEPEASMDRTVDTHIKNIRAKLKSIAPDAEPIVTHRGVGYALALEP